MHYLHRYYSLYSIKEFENCQVSQGLLQVAIFGFALKSNVQDYMLEHLSIEKQLALFDVEPATR